jgi:hypothetical protein
MRRETNNEMDLLLRRLSRRGDDAGRDGGTGPGDRHLDGDELSSYAQNVLPAAARARYSEHLSECVSCRKLVTELALSLGAVTAAAPVKTGIAATGLKAFLASLFSPMVLRYAVPALGVIVVMVVGFVVLRRQQRDEFVAQVGVEHKQQARETVQPGLVAPTPPPEGSHDGQQSKPENQQSPVDQRGERKRDAVVSEGAGTGAAAPATKSVDEVSPNETRPATVAAEPPRAAAKIAVSQEESKETNKEKKAEAPPKKQSETTDFVADGAKADANKPAAATANARRVSELPLQKRGYGDLQTLRPGSAGARDDKDTTEKEATETRSVAGRNFKKQRGIWIDTAYDSSTEIRNLARGSESFRALVADEPAINTIAEQLDGEVIVVWKGRAYRIR